MTLVLLPGLDGTGTLFGGFIRAFDGPTQVVEYPRDTVLSYDELFERIVAQLPADRPFVVLGESFSGPLAMRLGALAPAGLKAIVLASTFHRQPVSRALAALGFFARPFMFDMAVPDFVIARLMKGADAGTTRSFRALISSVHSKVLASRVRSVLRVDESKAWSVCRVPALVIEAKDDRLVKSHSAELRALNPSAEFASVPGPHLLLQVNPEAVVPIVQQFMAR